MRHLFTLHLPDAPTPEVALERLDGLPGRVLLRSAGGGGGRSFLAAAPLETLVVGEGEDPFAELDALLARWGVGDPAEESGGPHTDPEGESRISIDPVGVVEKVRIRAGEDPFPYAGGVIGFLSYEAGDRLERLPEPPADDVGVPLAWFGVYECGALWDADGGFRIVGSPLPGRTEEELLASMGRLWRRIRGAGGAVDGATGGAVSGGTGIDAAGGDSGVGGSLTSSLSRDDFLAGVRRIRDYILAGDLFQANLTRRLSAPTALTGLSLFRRLLDASPAPFAAYLDCGTLELASVSPELFLSLRGREVRTSPIKGTARRGSTPGEDTVLRDILARSEKDRAENIMIVDLLRNDLSRVSHPGTIRVPELARVETHPTVHHLVSTVTGTLLPGVDAPALLRATFPGGSITGAPKIRATEILRELEPVRRGVYTGAIGILGFDGSAELSIAIRTATLRDGVAHYGTGAGITLASSPEEEWEETEEKARAFRQALEGE